MKALIAAAAALCLGMLCAIILGTGVVLSLPSDEAPPTTRPAPVAPRPQPRPTPKPRPQPKPWLKSAFRPVGLTGQESLVNGRILEGETISADFPKEEWFKNIGSHVDGAGMCVDTSIEMVSLYLGMEAFRGFRDYWAKQEEGGGYPGKVERQLKEYCEAKGIECPRYVNFEGPNPEPLLEALDAQGIPFAHTYGWSPRYNQKIAHMVFSVKWGGKTGVVVDNNEIGGLVPAEGKIFEWMTREEHVRRMKYGQDSAWVFAWLVPPPPPCPRIEE